MSVNKSIAVIAVLLIALLVACGPTTSEPVATTEPEATPLPEGATPEAEDAADAVVAAAITQLAAELGLAEDEIEAISAEPAEFSDSCLGLGQANESCLQAITPGWVVMLSAPGGEYEVRTDETGAQARVAIEAPEGDAEADTVAAAVQEFMVSELGVALGDVQVISTERAEFTDSCLGLGGPDESCLQAITPGWIVVVDVNGQTYEAHTDETGQQVRVAGDTN